jgi:hypothetical protein
MDARRSRPRRLYHSSPHRLAIGRSIRPRWSPHFGVWKLWMTSSLAAARGVARGIVCDLQAGFGGFCGTTFGRCDFQAQKIYGVWIYRVKPTGPMERDGRNHWTTSFPVRVLEVVDVFGQPEKNRLTLPARRSLAHTAAVFAPVPEELVYGYERWLACPESKTAPTNGIVHDLLQGEMSWKDGKEIFHILSSCADDAQRLEAARQFCKRWIERNARSLASRQRRQHHKLFPDPRYKRTKSWRRLTED